MADDTVLVSKCCNAEVVVSGSPDFEGDKKPCTIYYVCSACEKTCDVVEAKK